MIYPRKIVSMSDTYANKGQRSDTFARVLQFNSICECPQLSVWLIEAILLLTVFLRWKPSFMQYLLTKYVSRIITETLSTTVQDKVSCCTHVIYYATQRLSFQLSICDTWKVADAAHSWKTSQNLPYVIEYDGLRAELKSTLRKNYLVCTNCGIGRHIDRKI